MLEQNSQMPEETTAALRRNLRDSLDSPLDPEQPMQFTDTGLMEKWIEDYLDQIYAPLVEAFSYNQRQEIRRELRAHIKQLVAAHMELGSDPEEATAAALRQFGPPELVARKWLDERSLEQSSGAVRKPSLRSVASAIRNSTACMAIAVTLWVSLGVLLDDQIRDFVAPILFFGFGMIMPGLIGVGIGRKHSQSRPMLSMLLAQALTLPAWPLLVMFLEQTFRHRGGNGADLLRFGAVSFLALAPTGCLGAWIGARMKRSSRKARRQAVR